MIIVVVVVIMIIVVVMIFVIVVVIMIVVVVMIIVVIMIIVVVMISWSRDHRGHHALSDRAPQITHPHGIREELRPLDPTMM